MKNIITILFLVFGSAIFAQVAVGVRIGNGSSGVTATPKTSNSVELDSEDEKMVAYVIFDENENPIQSNEINSTSNTTINVNSLEPGFYYIAVVSEDDEVLVDTYIKP